MTSSNWRALCASIAPIIFCSSRHQRSIRTQQTCPLWWDLCHGSRLSKRIWTLGLCCWSDRAKCEQNTSPCAVNTCHTRISSRVHVSQGSRSVSCIVFCLSKSHHLFHVSWYFCLMHHSLHLSLLHFGHMHPVRWLLNRCSALQRVQPLPLRKEDSSSAVWPNSPFSQIMSQSLSLKSAASTLRTPYFREKQSRHEPRRSRDHRGCVWNNRHDRCVTVEFTTVFSGARSKCSPIQCFWFSGTFKRGETSARCWVIFKCREIICRRVNEIEDWRMCNSLKFLRKGFCLNRKAFMNFLKIKLIELFKKNLRLRQDYLKHRLK